MRRPLSPLWMMIAMPMVVASPAFAQRASLAERVATLEQRVAEDKSRLELLNQVEALKEETRGLRGQMEDLQQQLAQQKESARSQYLDVDGRLTRIEGSAQPALLQSPPAPAAGGGAKAAPAVAAEAVSDAPAKSSGKDRVEYDVAFKALKAGDYVASARGFKALLEHWPKSALVPNAHYWLGESYYATGNHALAIESFRHVGETYPVDAKAPGAWLKMGMSQQAMKQDADAAVTYQYVIDSYAGSDAAKQAAERLKSLKKAPKR